MLIVFCWKGVMAAIKALWKCISHDGDLILRRIQTSVAPQPPWTSAALLAKTTIQGYSFTFVQYFIWTRPNKEISSHSFYIFLYFHRIVQVDHTTSVSEPPIILLLFFNPHWHEPTWKLKLRTPKIAVLKMVTLRVMMTMMAMVTMTMQSALSTCKKKEMSELLRKIKDSKQVIISLKP